MKQVVHWAVNPNPIDEWLQTYCGRKSRAVVPRPMKCADTHTRMCKACLKTKDTMPQLLASTDEFLKGFKGDSKESAWAYFNHGKLPKHGSKLSRRNRPHP